MCKELHLKRVYNNNLFQEEFFLNLRRNFSNMEEESKHLKGCSVPRVSNEIYSQQEILKFSCF